MSMQSESIDLLTTALVAAQADIGHAGKNAVNPHYRNDYANLESVIDAVRPVFAKHGLVILQPTDVTDSGPVVVTILAHKSGQYVKGVTPIINSKGDAQGMGSAISYARRYSLAAIANITQADDDGNEASGKSSKSVKPVSRKTPATGSLEEF